MPFDPPVTNTRAPAKSNVVALLATGHLPLVDVSAECSVIAAHEVLPHGGGTVHVVGSDCEVPSPPIADVASVSQMPDGVR